MCLVLCCRCVLIQTTIIANPPFCYNYRVVLERSVVKIDFSPIFCNTAYMHDWSILTLGTNVNMLCFVVKLCIQFHHYDSTNS